MKIWQRRGYIVLPFYVLAALLRLGAEAVRLAYWRAAYGWKIGRGVQVHWTVLLPRSMKVRLGDGVVIGQRTRFHAELAGGTLDVGPNTNIAQHCLIDVTGTLKIGANSTVSEGAAIYTHSHGCNPKSRPKPLAVSIGEDVWICVRGLVLPSTKTVGAGAIIGPGEVVRAPVPPKCMLVNRGQVETDREKRQGRST